MPLEGIEWDETKNEQNKRDHNGMDLETAQYVFADPERLERFDRSEGNTSGKEPWQKPLGKWEKLFLRFIRSAEKIKGLFPYGRPIRTKGEVTMGIITSTVGVGQKPPKEVLKKIKQIAREAKKHPEIYTEDCPASTPEALKEFAHLAAERNRQKKRQVVTLRLIPNCLSKYKALGKGYTGIMADVLNYAAENPEILSKVL